MTPALPALEPAVGHDLGANGRGGAPGQERATLPFAVERLLQGTLLTHPRSIGRAVPEPGDEHERPLGREGQPAGTGQRLVAAAPRPAARRPSSGDNCDSDAQSPHSPCHATMIRSSHATDKNFVEISEIAANRRCERRSVRECL